MSFTQDQLDSFYRFASDRITGASSDLSLSELLQLWQLENPNDEEREEVNAIIRQGDEDIAAGRGRPVEELHKDLRRKYNPSLQAT